MHMFLTVAKKEEQLPHTPATSAPKRAPIFEREGGNIAIVLFSLVMLMLVSVAGYFLIRSQSAAPVLKGPAIVNAPVHHAPIAMQARENPKPL